MPNPAPPTPQPGLLVPPAQAVAPLAPIGAVALRIARGILVNASALYAAMEKALINEYQAVWHPTAQGIDATGAAVTVTPQMILDAMRDAQGRPAAAALVTGHAMLAPVAEMIRQLYGNPAGAPIPTAAPAGFSVTINPDGSATIAAVPASAAPAQ